MNQYKQSPLNVTEKSRRRVFVGLGWDPNEKIGLLDKAREIAGGKKVHHDLDLSCYIYDAEKRYISHVSTEADRESDQTGQIYHSGDNVEGIGEGDDEQISVELKDLDPTIHAIVFKASIKSGHTFSEVNDPEVRLADGYSGHNFLECKLHDIDGGEKPAFIFACIIRGDDGQWLYSNIMEYTNAPEDANWAEHLKTYLP